MLEKDLKTRENIIEYCNKNNVNDRDKFYLLHAFEVDTAADLKIMLDYIREIDNCLPVPKIKNEDGPTKIYTITPHGK